MKIGICGLGMVGGAIAKFYKDAFLYDKYKNIGSVEMLNKADIIFVAVPTPYFNGSYDLDEMIKALNLIEDGKIVVLKSTIQPGTTNMFQEKYPDKKLLFCPEFLTEQTNDQDFQYPDKQLVGYTDKSFTIAKDILLMLPKAPFERILPAKEAELVKMMINSYYAMKVIFANQVYDFCRFAEIDYEKVLECFVSDKRISNSHFQVIHKGCRGYGGKCLPKDVRALIGIAKEIGFPLELLEKVEELNNKLNGGHKK